MNKQLISVYGTLRQGGSNNYLLKDSKFIGEFKTEPIFDLYSLGAFPGLKLNGNTSVTMEVYEVDEQTAKRVDQLEGYKEGIKPFFYDKIKLETPYGESSVYIYVNGVQYHNKIESGDWIEYVKKSKKKTSEVYS